MVRIIQVSDSHLSPAAPHADQNWAAVVEEVRRRDPDLVVHTGDISLDGAHDQADLAHARRLLDRLPVPWLAIPGNHDIGDVGDSADPVDELRSRRYGDSFGDGSWAIERDEWRLVGIDVQTLTSTLPASDQLWDWLDRVTKRTRPTALFVHRPLLPLADDELDEPRRYMTGRARTRLLQLVAERDVRVVASGHVHQWRTAERLRCRHVWAPSTWATLPDSWQPTIGDKVTGIVELTLGAVASVELLEPTGMSSPVIGEDFPSPYTH